MKFYSYIFTLICFFILFQSCNREEKSPYPNVQWEKKSDIPVKGLSSAAAASVGENGYVFFGRTSKYSYTKDCWAYDSTKDSWNKKTPCPGKSRVKAIAVELNGKIYTGLGYNGGVLFEKDSYLTDFWMYNPATDTWEQKADYPSHASDACISFVHNNKIYVGIGFYNTSFGHTLFEYDPDRDEWTQLKNFTGYARSVAVACYNNEHIFFGTGYRTSNENDWWEYEPGSDSWKAKKELPDDGRVCAVALCVDNRVFVATGRYFRGNYTGGHLKSDLYEYDIIRNCWYNRGNMPANGRENAISFTIGNKGYIGLGENESGSLNDLWCFEP